MDQNEGSPNLMCVVQDGWTGQATLQPGCVQSPLSLANKLSDVAGLSQLDYTLTQLCQ